MTFRHLGAFIAAFLVLTAAMSADAGYKPREHYSNGADYEPYEGKGSKYRSGRRAPCAHDCDGAYRYVYAESWYGFKKVTAPVRRAKFGDQVRLPGGAWVYCEFSCEYTLRKQSLDFWEGQGQGFVSPGYIRKDFYIDDWGRRHYRY